MKIEAIEVGKWYYYDGFDEAVPVICLAISDDAVVIQGPSGRIVSTGPSDIIAKVPKQPGLWNRFGMWLSRYI